MRTAILLSVVLWAGILLIASCATKPAPPARHGWQPTNMPIRGHEHVHRGIEQKTSFVQTST